MQGFHHAKAYWQTASIRNQYSMLRSARLIMQDINKWPINEWGIDIASDYYSLCYRGVNYCQTSPNF